MAGKAVWTIMAPARDLVLMYGIMSKLPDFYLVISHKQCEGLSLAQLRTQLDL